MSRAAADAVALAADQPAVTGSDALPQPQWRSGFNPERRLTHNETCLWKASNAFWRDGHAYFHFWQFAGGSFAEVGASRHWSKT